MKVSKSKNFFITKSRGDYVQKLGEWLTYKSQGFKFSSMSISNPKISKHTESD